VFFTLILAIVIFIDIRFNIDFLRMHIDEENGLKFLEWTIVTIGIVYVVTIFYKKTIVLEDHIIY